MLLWAEQLESTDDMESDRTKSPPKMIKIFDVVVVAVFVVVVVVICII